MEPTSEQPPRTENLKEILVAKIEELVRRDGKVVTEKPLKKMAAYQVDLKTARFSRKDMDIFLRLLGPVASARIILISKPKETQIQLHAKYPKETQVISLLIPEGEEPRMWEYKDFLEGEKAFLPSLYTGPVLMKVKEETLQTFIDLLDQSQLEKKG